VRFGRLSRSTLGTGAHRRPGVDPEAARWIGQSTTVGGVCPVRLALVCIALFVSITEVAAQELTPRFYWPAPEGAKVAVLGYSRSVGDVLFDPSTPLFEVDSDIHTTVLAYMQTFGIAGRTANVLAELPYSWGTTKGYVGEVAPGMAAGRDYSGLGDAKVTLSVNLLGAPTMTAEDFLALRADPHPILGASVRIVAPTGRYDDDRLVNIGTNRWAARLELGSAIPFHKKWVFEFAAGVWFFTDDDDFLTGRREQEPIYAFQAHLVHRFKAGLWAALAATYFTGGRQTIGGDKLSDVLRNSRIGAMVAVPFKGRHAIKLGYFIGARTDYGSDFDQFLATYQVLFK